MKARHLVPWFCVAVLCGCSTWDLHTVRSQSPDESEASDTVPRLVGDMAASFGMFPVKVEAVGLVTGLHGTGSDPEPSAQRSMLIEEMRRRDVKNPNALLASRNVSLVLVRGILRPGIQKGDHFDVEIRIPSRSETTSLRGGYLLETRLTDMEILGTRPFEGKLRAVAQGPVLVDPSADEKKDRVLAGRGRVLGGAVAIQSRSIGLVLKPGHQNEINSARLASTINKRFHTFQKGIKVGVAKAKTDKYIDLMIHPRYKESVDRYMQVVRAVSLQESAADLGDRLAELEKKLSDPATAAGAAVQLEATGGSGVEVLLKGIRSKDREVRFFSAESLAYLDRREAAEPLAEAAKQEPAFRAYALTALSAMSGAAEMAANEQLRGLLAVHSAETRYGAFRALWMMNPNDALVKGEQLGGQFSYHVVDAPGPAMIHVTRNRRSELVLFGQTQHFLTPMAVNAGPRIMVTNTGKDQVAVARFAPDEADQKRTVSNRVDDVIRAIVEVGGTYPDVVQALQEAKAAGALDSRFEVDALPEPGRVYERFAQTEGEEPKPGGTSPADGKGLSKDEKNAAKKADSPAAGKSVVRGQQSDDNPQSRKGWFARILGRDSS